MSHHQLIVSYHHLNTKLEIVWVGLTGFGRLWIRNTVSCLKGHIVNWCHRSTHYPWTSCHIDHALSCGLLHLLTLIIALEVMRKRVARSLTALIFSPPSTGTFRPSSSLSERCKAAPCFAMRSLHVLRSSSLLTSIFKVPWSSLRPDWDVGSSSPESSGGWRWEVTHTILNMRGSLGLVSTPIIKEEDKDNM